jgi:hypothetical protein
MVKYVLSLLVCACVMASPVLAGGGGAKKDANIRIVHNLPAGTLTGAGAGNDSLIVIANPPAALITKVNGGTAVPKDITAAGGVIIKQGRSATIPVKSGTVKGCAAVVRPGGLVVPIANQNFTVAKGKTLVVNASTVPRALPTPW